MKRILFSILAAIGLLTAPAAFAQSSTHTPYQQPVYYAVDYGQWGIRSQSANTYLFSPLSLCVATASGGQFFPFATTAPVWIQDATASLSEVVTPSTVTNASTQCGFTASPANSHTQFTVSSGTGGLQEALNAFKNQATGRPALVILDRNWYTTAGAVTTTTPEAILGAATGSTHAVLSDITTLPWTNYVWNESAYVSGTWVNTKPVAAAGAGAGTSPTISNTGTALINTVSVTTGTATTTGTLFTDTWATTGQFLASPTCTVTSIGTNAYTTFTSAVTFPSSTHALLTVTVGTANPVASTAYKFRVSCS